MNASTSTTRPEEVAVYVRYMWQCPLCRGINLSLPAVLEPHGEARSKGATVDPTTYTLPNGVVCEGCGGAFGTVPVYDEWDGRPL